MKYNITNNNLSRVLSEIEENLKENKETINKLLKIDNQYCKMKINLEMLINVINSLKNEEIDIQEQQKISIKYNGNPCITLNLSILAILCKNIIVLDYGETMIGINSFIVQIVNDVLKDYKTDKLIYINEEKDDDIDKIICIDDIYKYNTYRQNQSTKIQFYSLEYLDFYSDSDEFDEIQELIYKYAEINSIPIENYSELGVNEAIQMMQNGLGKSIVVLTKDDETKESFRKKIKDKKIYINKNPFEGKIRIINKEILHTK